MAKKAKIHKKAGFLLIKGQTFPYDVIVCIGVTRGDIFHYFEKRFLDSLTESDKKNIVMEGHGRTIVLENRALILWLKEFPKTPEHFGHLAHEIFHTSDLMLRRLGASLSDDSDEVFAYQVDWITKNIYKYFELCKK